LAWLGVSTRGNAAPPLSQASRPMIPFFCPCYRDLAPPPAAYSFLSGSDDERAYVVAGGLVVLHVGAVAEREGLALPAPAVDALVAGHDLLVVDDLLALEINLRG